MKKVLWLALTCFIFTSCSFSVYECPAYGNTNNNTKQGVKAQNKYHKDYRKRAV